jgi:hypothetical protein
MDAAVEARQDTEQVSADYNIRREDVQDAFAWQTRRMIRHAEGLLRTIQQQLADVDAMLRGETRRARKEPQAAGAGRDAGRAA